MFPIRSSSALTIEAFTCACEDVMRIHYCVSLLVSENLFLHLQKAQVWTGASCPSKETTEVPGVFVQIQPRS